MKRSKRRFRRVHSASAIGNRRGFRCREIAGKNRVSCGNSSVRAGRAAMPVGMTRRTRVHGSVDAHGKIRRCLRWMGHRHGRFRFRIFCVVNKRATRGRSMIAKSTPPPDAEQRSAFSAAVVTLRSRWSAPKPQSRPSPHCRADWHERPARLATIATLPCNPLFRRIATHQKGRASLSQPHVLF